MMKEKCLKSLDQYVKKIGKTSKSFVVSINAPKLGINYQYNKDDLSHPFFIGSIGKMFTSVLILMCVDKKMILIDEKVKKYFSDGFLDQLFFYEDKDYQEVITFDHLLRHTSGIADYFEGSVMFGDSFIDMMIKDKDKQWSPEDLIEFTRFHQKAADKPGSNFYYSDTGYVLLGLLLEKLHGKTFEDIIKENILIPLKMNQTYLYSLLNYDKKMLPIEINGHNLTNEKSLTCDWSGGCAISSAYDLTLFMSALYQNQLLKKETLNEALSLMRRFHLGLYYGQGFMETRFEKFFYLLKRYKLPKLIGHISSMSSHLWLNPEDGTCIVINFGSNRYITKSFNVLIYILKKLKKVTL